MGKVIRRRKKAPALLARELLSRRIEVREEPPTESCVIPFPSGESEDAVNDDDDIVEYDVRTDALIEAESWIGAVQDSLQLSKSTCESCRRERYDSYPEFQLAKRLERVQRQISAIRRFIRENDLDEKIKEID